MGIIYKTTNLINGKWYIGKDEKNNPKYLGSGLLLNKAIEKHGRDNFKKEMLAECADKHKLAELERKIIAETGAVTDTMAYNIAPGGNGGHIWGDFDDVRKIEIRAKMKKSDAEKESRRKFAKEHNLSKFMIDGRTRGRKRWWASLSEDEKFKMQSSRSTGWWTNLTNEEQCKISAYRKENTTNYFKTLTKEERTLRAEKQRNKISRTCKITSPTGEIIITNRLREKSKELGISYNSLNISIKEQRSVKNGWMCEVIGGRND
jgi:hypothetical protein